VTVRELPVATELAGRARITTVDDVGEGDLWNFPSVVPHSIQGLEEGCEFLLVFDDGPTTSSSIPLQHLIRASLGSLQSA
jgi:hypothetical protein